MVDMKCEEKYLKRYLELDGRITSRKQQESQEQIKIRISILYTYRNKIVYKR